jgi:hypothetical protein
MIFAVAATGSMSEGNLRIVGGLLRYLLPGDHDRAPASL